MTNKQIINSIIGLPIKIEIYKCPFGPYKDGIKRGPRYTIIPYYYPDKTAVSMSYRLYKDALQSINKYFNKNINMIDKKRFKQKSKFIENAFNNGKLKKVILP